nr:leucine-rich repeat domain-containing protein [Acholeplasmatales bacterium]
KVYANVDTIIGLFMYCDNLQSVKLPDSLTSIGERSFLSCKSLSMIVVSKDINSIGEEAFYGCSNLKTVYNLSNLLLTIGQTDNGYVAYYADNIYDSLSE